MMHYVIPTDRFAQASVVKRFAKYIGAYQDYETDKESRSKFRFQIAVFLAYVGGGRSPDAIMKDYNENRASFLDRMREIPDYFAGCTEALNKVDPMPKSAWYSFLSIHEKFKEAVAQPNFAELVDELMQAAEKVRAKAGVIENLMKKDAESITKDDIVAAIKVATGATDEQAKVLDRLTAGMSRERVMKAFLEAEEAKERIVKSDTPLKALADEIGKVLGGKDKSKPESSKPGNLDLGNGLRASVVEVKDGESLKDALARTLSRDLGLDEDHTVVQKIADAIVHGTADKRTVN